MAIYDKERNILIIPDGEISFKNILSKEEVFQLGFDAGYEDGYEEGIETCGE